jgi:hypothetical protein
MATVMNMLNIPFKECFTVCTAWEVRPSSGGGCACNIYGKVRCCCSSRMIPLNVKWDI